MMLRFHTQTGGATLTAQQPENNIVRTAYQALAAVLGGTQSLHTNAMDEALALPSEDAARLALRTQQILAHETGVPDTADPLAGSYYVEALTEQVETEARTYLERIDAMGGALAAIDAGFQRREIEENAYRLQKALEERRRIVVGVNAFEEEVQPGVPLLRVDPAVEERQSMRLRALRERRDAVEVSRALGRIEAAARGADNLMPLLIEAVESLVTVGEICDHLRSVWGEYTPVP
jgi:methylmalonyl-CoA mutase N-terminal domain/subunit